MGRFSRKDNQTSTRDDAEEMRGRYRQRSPSSIRRIGRSRSPTSNENATSRRSISPEPGFVRTKDGFVSIEAYNEMVADHDHGGSSSVSDDTRGIEETRRLAYPEAYYRAEEMRILQRIRELEVEEGRLREEGGAFEGQGREIRRIREGLEGYLEEMRIKRIEIIKYGGATGQPGDGLDDETRYGSGTGGVGESSRRK